MTKRQITYLFICVGCLIITLSLIVGCVRTTSEPEPKPPVPIEKSAPRRVGVPSQMIQQCINQPDIPYCEKRCEDTGLLNKPKWC
jgi:hypothetical protein